jgi:hypothetical protein
MMETEDRDMGGEEVIQARRQATDRQRGTKNRQNEIRRKKGYYKSIYRDRSALQYMRERLNCNARLKI